MHLDGAYKELRADGIFSGGTPEVFGFEYQSTYNIGMPVRAFMYQEAFDEKNPKVLNDDGINFVVIYSGQDMPKKAREEEHLKVRQKTVSYLFIDLDQIDAGKLEADGLHSKILRLSRLDATDFDLFRDAAEEINALSDASERHRLMAALVLASMNKPGLGIRMLELNMDEEIRRNLEAMIPIMDYKRIDDEKRRGMRIIAEIAKAPGWIYDTIDEAESEELEELYELIFEAAKSEDWTTSGFAPG